MLISSGQDGVDAELTAVRLASPAWTAPLPGTAARPPQPPTKLTAELAGCHRPSCRRQDLTMPRTAGLPLLCRDASDAGPGKFTRTTDGSRLLHHQSRQRPRRVGRERRSNRVSDRCRSNGPQSRCARLRCAPGRRRRNALLDDAQRTIDIIERPVAAGDRPGSAG